MRLFPAFTELLLQKEQQLFNNQLPENKIPPQPGLSIEANNKRYLVKTADSMNYLLNQLVYYSISLSIIELLLHILQTIDKITQILTHSRLQKHSFRATINELIFQSGNFYQSNNQLHQPIRYQAVTFPFNHFIEVLI